MISRHSTFEELLWPLLLSEQLQGSLHTGMGHSGLKWTILVVMKCKFKAACVVPCTVAPCTGTLHSLQDLLWLVCLAYPCTRLFQRFVPLNKPSYLKWNRKRCSLMALINSFQILEIYFTKFKEVILDLRNVLLCLGMFVIVFGFCCRKWRLISCSFHIINSKLWNVCTKWNRKARRSLYPMCIKTSYNSSSF